MGIPESQFETWSHQGAVTTAKLTSDSIKNALDSYGNWGVKYEVYLQGSYKNDTNIRGDMDVDVVAQLNSTFYSNLSEEQKRFLSLSSASYNWPDFKSDVLHVLRDYYGYDAVVEGNKSIKIKGSSSRLPADVVVCAQYRRYRSSNINDYIEGMCFWSRNDNRQIINYPKIHHKNGVTKNSRTNGLFKPTVRIFKNARTYLIDNVVIAETLVPSYFLECLIYNVPNEKFSSSYQETFCNLVNWLVKADFEGFCCLNEQLLLFGNTPEQWTVENARRFIQKLIELWNNW